MSGPLCQVCWNLKRKARFQTRSVRICQWCITELTNSLESPIEIIEAAKTHLREKRLSPLLAKLQALGSVTWEKPAPLTAEFERAAVRAKQEVLEREGIGQFLYRQLFDKSPREIEVEALTKQFRNAIELKHETNLKSHELRLQELVSSVALTQTDIAGVEAAVEVDFKKFMDIRLLPRPTKFSSTRLLRAHNLGLIQPNRIYAMRPDGAEAEEMARYVRQRDSYVCVICSRVPKGSELHVHHIIPLSFFGTNNTQNLATLCYACHNRQHPEFEVQRINSNANSNRSEV